VLGLDSRWLSLSASSTWGSGNPSEPHTGPIEDGSLGPDLPAEVEAGNVPFVFDYRYPEAVANLIV